MGDVHILPIKYPDSETIEMIANQIEKIIGLNTKVYNIKFNYNYSRDPARMQYHSSQLLLGLKRFMKSQNGKILGITSLDLFIPILTYVFGEAELNGTAAIVSDHRLDPQFYGLPQDTDLLRKRLVKESIHELGHTLGLQHCTNYECALNVSTYVEEIDLKCDCFCSECHNIIQAIVHKSK
jgi:archaemetzincin